MSSGETATSAAWCNRCRYRPPAGSGSSATWLGLPLPAALVALVMLLVLLAVAGSVAWLARKEVGVDPDPLAATAARRVGFGRIATVVEAIRPGWWKETILVRVADIRAHHPGS